MSEISNIPSPYPQVFSLQSTESTLPVSLLLLLLFSFFWFLTLVDVSGFLFRKRSNQEGNLENVNHGSLCLTYQLQLFLFSTTELGIFSPSNSLSLSLVAFTFSLHLLYFLFSLLSSSFTPSRSFSTTELCELYKLSQTSTFCLSPFSSICFPSLQFGSEFCRGSKPNRRQEETRRPRILMKKKEERMLFTRKIETWIIREVKLSFKSLCLPLVPGHRDLDLIVIRNRGCFGSVFSSPKFFSFF